MKKTFGIYKIQSKIKPNRIYIGSTADISQRWNQHICHLRTNTHANKKLQNHFNKYSESDLIFSIIEPCLPEYLIIREQYYLNTLNPWFNCRLIAESNKGMIPSEETRIKMGKAHKGKRSPMEGKKHSTETREKMRKSALNREPRSEEVRLKISKTLMGHSSIMKGTTLSQEHRDNIKKSWEIRKLVRKIG